MKAMGMPEDINTGWIVTSQWASLDAALLRWWTSRPARGQINPLRLRMSGFIRWCARSGKVPEFIDDATIMEYLLASKETTRRRPSPRREERIRQAWNYAACAVPGWPAVWVTPHASKRLLPTRTSGGIVAFPYYQYQPSLVAEVDQYCRNGGFLGEGESEIAKGSHRERIQSRLNWLNSLPKEGQRLAYPARRLRPLVPASLYWHKRLIFRTATAIHLSGEADLSDLRRILDVITPTGAAALADMSERRRGTDLGGPDAARGVSYFFAIARRCGLIFSIAEQEAILQLLSDLHYFAHGSAEISERNLRLLAQFDDTKKFSMLIALPSFEMSELKRARSSRGVATLAEARRARNAIAIEILNLLPIRVGTLSQLDLARNFIKAGEESMKLVIFPAQEKSQKILEAPIGSQSWKLISTYRRHYRPFLLGADHSTLLFPDINGAGHTLAAQLSKQITKLVGERLGVQINVHLWRHIMANKLVEKTRQPEDAERLLGHAPGSTATKRYIRVRSKDAATLLQEVTTEARGRGMKLLGRPN